MSDFVYTAADKDGAITQGKMDAPDKDTAAKLIIDQGLTPLKIKDSQSVSISNLGASWQLLVFAQGIFLGIIILYIKRMRKIPTTTNE